MIENGFDAMPSSTTVALLIAATAFGAVVWYSLWRRGPSAREDRHKGRPARREVRAELGERAARRSARFTRPGLADYRKARIEECAVLLGFQTDGGWPRAKVYAKLEDSQIICGPPGAGKSIKLKETIKDFPGPVVATSTKLDIIEHTAARRRRTRGPVELFNPENLGGRRSTLRWDPVADCTDPGVAIDRAGYLLSGTAAGGGTADREFWTNNANKVLRALLFTAAHYGFDLLQVKRWANNPSEARATAVDLLIRMGERAPVGWADELAQILNSYDRFRESVFATLAQTFDFLGHQGAAEMVRPQPGERVFDAKAFLSQRGTLYCIGAHKDYGSIAPLFCALTGLIYDTAKRMGQASGGRLDPPVLFALDEAPNIVSLPLHRLTSEARGLGITFVVCIQSRKQLEDVWGPTRGGVIWSNCKIKMILPGEHDDGFLESISKLCGEYQALEKTESASHDGKVSVSTRLVTKRAFPPEQIRMLPDSEALVIAANKKALTVLIDPFWERRSVKRAEAKASKRASHAPVPLPPQPRPPTRDGTPVVAPATATISAIHPGRTGDNVEEASG